MFCGSITNCPTMCIVNSSNTSIGLGSGVSSAIRQACGGVEFQQECREVLYEQFDGILPQGEVAVTTGNHRWRQCISLGSSCRNHGLQEEQPDNLCGGAKLYVQ